MYRGKTEKGANQKTKWMDSIYRVRRTNLNNSDSARVRKNWRVSDSEVKSDEKAQKGVER